MITIVIGAQYGGEGKGKIAAFLAKHRDFSAICRVGGVNSSHTIVNSRGSYRFRMLPAAISDGTRSKIVFGAGSLIHVPTLLKEMSDWSVDPGQVLIDESAGIIDQKCVDLQRADARYGEIGSTLTGTGYATAARARRELGLARDVGSLHNFLGSAEEFLFNELRSDRDVLIEGHQGAMLSNYHGDYPYCSSRDCTAAECLSELGIGLKWKTEVVLVVKTFEVRNHPGALTQEIHDPVNVGLNISEFGGGSWNVPDRRRRVGMFGIDVVRKACRLNTPDCIALTGADYLFPAMRDSRSSDRVSRDFEEFVKSVEQQTGVLIKLVSTGRDTDSCFVNGSGDKVGLKNFAGVTRDVVDMTEENSHLR